MTGSVTGSVIGPTPAAAAHVPASIGARPGRGR